MKKSSISSVPSQDPFSPLYIDLRFRLEDISTLFRSINELSITIRRRGSIDSETTETLRVEIELYKSRLSHLREGLARLVRNAMERADARRKIELLRERIRRADDAITSFVTTVSSSMNETHVALHEAELTRSIADKASQSPIPMDQLMQYAKRISFASSAPPGWTVNTPLGVHLSPCPRDFSLSILYSDIHQLLQEELSLKRRKVSDDDAFISPRGGSVHRVHSMGAMVGRIRSSASDISLSSASPHPRGEAQSANEKQLNKPSNSSLSDPTLSDNSIEPSGSPQSQPLYFPPSSSAHRVRLLPLDSDSDSDSD